MDTQVFNDSSNPEPVPTPRARSHQQDVRQAADFAVGTPDPQDVARNAWANPSLGW